MSDKPIFNKPRGNESHVQQISAVNWMAVLAGAEKLAA